MSFNPSVSQADKKEFAAAMERAKAQAAVDNLRPREERLIEMTDDEYNRYADRRRRGKKSTVVQNWEQE